MPGMTLTGDFPKSRPEAKGNFGSCRLVFAAIFANYRLTPLVR